MAAEKYGGNKLLCHVAKTSFGRWNYKIGIECGRVVQQRGCKENKISHFFQIVHQQCVIRGCNR